MTTLPIHSRLGFDGDPFQHTNADVEERLGQYFVSPPFFGGVLGDVAAPAPAVVYAPRGGGKSAMRKMIEAECEAGSVLCLTYDEFDVDDDVQESPVALELHLRSLLRLAVIGVLARIDASPEMLEGVAKHRLVALRRMIEISLTNITEAQFSAAVSNVRGVGGNIRSFIDRHIISVNAIVSAICEHYKLPQLPLAARLPHESEEAELRELLRMVMEIAREVGFPSVFILVDRVDETQFTANAPEAAYNLLRALLSDLGVLEMTGLGVKFFLSDLIKSHHSGTARPDRVREYEVSWDDSTLGEMLTKRLGAYSDWGVTSLRDACSGELASSIDHWVVTLAESSPRDTIRLCKSITDQQHELDATANAIGDEAIQQGITRFCRIRASELVEEQSLRDLRRVGKAVFTVNELASDHLRVAHNTARNRVQRWQQMGLIERVADIPVRGGRPRHRYAVRDLRVLHDMMQGPEIADFMDGKFRVCPNCGKHALRDFDIIGSAWECISCGEQLA